MNKCVFWYPTIYHSLINDRFRHFERESVISDFGSPAIIKVKINCKYHSANNDDVLEARQDSDLIESPIIIGVYKKNEDETLEKIFSDIILEYCIHSNNGMVVYQYTKPDDYPSQNAPEFNRFLSTVCYHNAKTLFHEHEVQRDRDSGLIAYIPSEMDSFNQDCIKQDNNKVLLYFLKQYGEFLSGYAEQASSRIRKFEDVAMKFQERVSVQDDNGGVFGYNDLLDFGIFEFIRWHKDPTHKKEVWQCKRDVLNWDFKVNPHKSRTSRRWNSYYKRIKRIKGVLKQNPTDIGMDNEEMKLYEKKFEKTFKSFEKKSNTGWLEYHNPSRQELFPLNAKLAEIEIGLNIYKKRVSYFLLYRKLRKIRLDTSKLTADSRNSVSQLCEGASTEYVYCKTLLESKYNTKVKPYNGDKTADEERRLACNIRNSMRYIETAKYRCANAQIGTTHSILMKAERLNRNAKIWTVLATILTIISIILCILFAKQLV